MDIFIPDIYAQSIYTIDYDKLKQRKVKCILFDLDNTLVPISAKMPDQKLKDLIARIEDKGFKVILLSNSRKPRVEPFKNGLNIDSAHSSMKPLKTKYKKILKLYNFKDNEVAAVGDQLMTDVFGANRMGMVSILVNPISNIDFFNTKINRFFEKIIFKRLNKRGLFTKGEYYD